MFQGFRDLDFWKKEPYQFSGGGPVYFRILFDLKAKKFVWYEHNSEV